jgi:hypothetical protein
LKLDKEEVKGGLVQDYINISVGFSFNDKMVPKKENLSILNLTFADP